MRLWLFIWCALGLGLIGLKAHLDRSVLKYPDVAVRVGGETFLIPRALIASDAGWRTDLRRLAGCWDAREGGVVQAASSVAGCDQPLAFRLKVPPQAIGGDASGQPVEAVFWTAYAPPAEHLPQLMQAWRGDGEWAGRRLVMRPDWSVVRLESGSSPWVHLLAREPRAGERIQELYAGRCYRPEPLSDAGMTCTAVVRIGHSAAFEYSLGPDEVMGFGVLRVGFDALARRWRR